MRQYKTPTFPKDRDSGRHPLSASGAVGNMHPFLFGREPIERICPQLGLLANAGVFAARFLSTETLMSCDLH